jgi:hypothetical protein
MRVAYIGAPHSRLGVAGGTAQLVGAIIQAGVQLTMATVQLVYGEIQERRARRQYRHDQQRAQAEAYKQAEAMERQNAELRAYIQSLTGGGPAAQPGAAQPGAITGFTAHPYFPYVVIGGGVLILALVLKRRK